MSRHLLDPECRLRLPWSAEVTVDGPAGDVECLGYVRDGVDRLETRHPCFRRPGGRSATHLSVGQEQECEPVSICALEDGFTATEILSVTAGTAPATMGRPPEVCGFGPPQGQQCDAESPGNSSPTGLTTASRA